MELMKRAEAANRWAKILVQELTERLHNRSAQLAEELAGELQAELDEDFRELLPSVPAEQLSEVLAAELRTKLLEELQEGLPLDVRKILHKELEKLVFEQLDKGQSKEDIRLLALQREDELAEHWARWVAGEMTHLLLERLAEQLTANQE